LFISKKSNLKSLFFYLFYYVCKKELRNQVELYLWRIVFFVCAFYVSISNKAPRWSKQFEFFKS